MPSSPLSVVAPSSSGTNHHIRSARTATTLHRQSATTQTASHQLSYEALPDRESLFAEFAPLVRKLTRQYGHNPALREELPGEIYYRFCKVLDAYDPKHGVPLRPYIVCQLTRSLYMFARHDWLLNSREVFLEGSPDEQSVFQHRDPTPQWDEGIYRKQMLSGLWQSLTRLPPRQQQVIRWRYLEDRSFEEIASALQIQPSTARSLLRHGLNNLRKLAGTAPKSGSESRQRTNKEALQLQMYSLAG